MNSCGGRRAREPQHRQHDGQRVLGAMVDLARQQHLALLGALAVGDVDGDAVHAHRPAGGVARDDAGAVAPAYLAARPHDPELDLEARQAVLEDGGKRVLGAVVGMDHRLDALDGRLEGRGIDVEDAVGAVVPFDAAARDVDLPRAHVAGRERDRAALLALAQALGLRLELGGARRRPAPRARRSAPRAGGSCGRGRRTPGPWRAAPWAPPAPRRSRRRRSRSRADGRSRRPARPTRR